MQKPRIKSLGDNKIDTYTLQGYPIATPERKY